MITTTIKNASKYFGKIQALKDVNLEIKTGEVVLIIGPSGIGKSTLLRSVNRLEHLTSGEIWIDDELITDHKADMRRIREKTGTPQNLYNNPKEVRTKKFLKHIL